MLLQEMLRIERGEGIAEGRALSLLDFLKGIGLVTEELKKKILAEQSVETLQKWCGLVTKVTSIEQL